MNPVRSLLLTDLVDSTRLADTLGFDAAAALGTAHDRVASDLPQARQDLCAPARRPPGGPATSSLSRGRWPMPRRRRLNATPA